MQLPKLPQMPKIGRLSKKHKITAAGAAAATAVVLAVTGLQATGGSSSAAAVGDPTGYKVATGDQTKTSSAPKTDSASQKALADQAAAQKKAAADAAAKKAAAEALAKKKAAAAAARKAAAKKAAHRAAVKRAAERAAANRSLQRAAIKVKPVASKAPAAPVKTYTNNLDGWIRHSLDIMAVHHIPGSYDGIYRNIIRESSGNPNAINLWDSNAAKGIPSKGLLQVIDPTFQAYHVDGTSWNIYDPVANITAACNYAYHVYGSMDNVNSAY